MSAPLAIDLFCGVGGWTEGLLAEGWDVIGFDIERHVYGEHRYPAQLVLQDVRTLHGSQFKDAHLIVASSPCQECSYRAMPWKRAKALGPPYLGMELFAQAARIQREACEAASRFIPMIQENVCGAQRWVGRARWHYGSYYLWGDVPALMPTTMPKEKAPGQDWNRFRKTGEVSEFNSAAERAARDWIKNGGRMFPKDAATARAKVEIAEGRKIGGEWFHGAREHTLRRHSSKSSARKAASARIAKIPFALASYIAHVYHPARAVEGAA